MKKRIIVFVSCVFVLVAALVVSASADYNASQWEWLFDRRNPLDFSNVLDPAYDVDKTPDIYLSIPSTLEGKPDFESYSLIYDLPCYLRLTYYNYVTQTNGVMNVPIGQLSTNFHVTEGEAIVDQQWAFTYVLRDGGVVNFGLDVNADYWVSLYYPHLRITEIEVFGYLNGIRGDPPMVSYMRYDQDGLAKYGLYTDFPYVARNYFDQGGYDAGYADGEADGFVDGFELGKMQSYDKGYEEGKTAGILEGERNGTAWMNFKNLIFMIFDAPFYVLSTALDFNVFGINIAGTLIGLISLALIVWILKIIIVRLF